MTFLKRPATESKEKPAAKEEKVVSIEKQTEQPARKAAEKAPHAKPKSSRATPAATPVPKRSEHSREPFSTRLRVNLIRRLKDVSYHRERDGAEPHTIQAITEEALEAWLAKSE